MKTVGGGQKPAARRRRVVCACALASAMVVASSGRAAREPQVIVTVRVYNYAKVSRRALSGAEREASRILNTAGIHTMWVDRLAPQTDVRSGPPPAQMAETANSGCDAPVSGVTVGLRILAGNVPSKDFNDEKFGFATGDLASVFYQRVVDLAWNDDKNRNEIPLILGDVIAHELGHLLLGTNSHSPAGIMCANWDREYLLLALRGRQLFSPEQSALMRATILRRHAPSIQP